MRRQREKKTKNMGRIANESEESGVGRERERVKEHSTTENH